MCAFLPVISMLTPEGIFVASVFISVNNCCIICYIYRYHGAFLVAQMVKNLSAVQETGFNPWVGKIPWRSEWPPSPVFLPGEFHGQKAWWATVHGVIKSLTGLSDFSLHCFL